MTVRRRTVLSIGLVALMGIGLTACSGSSAGSDNGKIEGEITVLTNRTDLIDTTLKTYAAEFHKKYPAVTVKFEGVTDYEGDVKVRLNSRDYGDVLLVPNAVTKKQLPAFFEPLGTVDELGKKYQFIHEQAYDGKVYGLATFGTAAGYVVNKKVWAQAGVTTPPTTPAEFLADLTAVKQKTGAIPYYTNYADGWPMAQWQNVQGSIAGPDAVQQRDDSDAPWSAGSEQADLDGLLYDVVHSGLSEKDPTTTNWEESKNQLASGKISAMVLGSWAVPQIQAATTSAGTAASDIAFWPMPWQSEGSFHATIAGDYKIGISKYSQHKAAARAWIDWFLNDSGFAASQGGLSPQVGAELPAALADYNKLGVKLVEMDAAPAGKESLDSDIYNAAEIDLFGQKYRQKLIDIARGAASGDKQSYFEELNGRWATARKSVSD